MIGNPPPAPARFSGIPLASASLRRSVNLGDQFLAECAQVVKGVLRQTQRARHVQQLEVGNLSLQMK
ncbi:hypothetical protein PRIPAC_78606 [Pristionchus pacificus]|uniref:Uncharacterized protein n=1 Tax=Pristionchus pacificus TaxID=54126 RepID=A0A2A6CJW7_PRIPA|nr:hypothetical protein PRIPAC_78606 [Pristionchus pacificus]|eukprot:PDM78396.1 hypothetical protein PRIPAC_30975 [Pristionchus pacificus]